MKLYYPYKANDGKHKYYIITKTGKKISFGSYGYSDMTQHKDEARKQRYINRHKNKENWNDFNSAAAWSRFLLWEEPNIKNAYKKIKDKLLKWGIISKEQYNQYVF